MAKNAMPMSKAENAYEFLDEIARLIVEEPKRYNQRQWKQAMDQIRHDLLPACQTVCCIAGWVDTLKNPEPVHPSKVTLGDWGEGRFGNVGDFAKDVLGLTHEQAEYLFDSHAAGGRTNDYDEALDEDLGDITEDTVRKHAERGARHIRAFMADHEAQLKAKKV